MLLPLLPPASAQDPDHASYLESAAREAAETLKAGLSSHQGMSLLQLLGVVPPSLEELRAEVTRIAKETKSQVLCGDKTATKGLVRLAEKVRGTWLARLNI